MVKKKRIQSNQNHGNKPQRSKGQYHSRIRRKKQHDHTHTRHGLRPYLPLHLQRQINSNSHKGKTSNTHKHNRNPPRSPKENKNRRNPKQTRHHHKKENKNNPLINSSNANKINNKPKQIPKEVIEPQMQRKDNTFIILLPEVKGLENIEIRELDESIEIKAVNGDKVYFKIIPIRNMQVVSKKLEDGKLTLEIGKKIKIGEVK
jgi:hypothetical protein